MPDALTEGARSGGAVVLGAWALGALAFVVWAFAGWGDVTGVAGSLDADPVGALALAIGEGLYAPTLAMWGVAWMAGPGFAVGAGTEYAPGHLTTTPLPSIPLLGALPQAAGGVLVLAPLLVVALAAGARAVASRRRRVPSGRAQAVAVLVVGLLAGVGALVSRGSLGGGDLTVVGPEPVATGVWMAALAAIGFAAGSLVARWRGR